MRALSSTGAPKAHGAALTIGSCERMGVESRASGAAARGSHAALYLGPKTLSTGGDGGADVQRRLIGSAVRSRDIIGGSRRPHRATVPTRRPHRPEAQDAALSRLKHGFESRWGRQPHWQNSDHQPI
jgi:hypothetical protein